MLFFIIELCLLLFLFYNNKEWCITIVLSIVFCILINLHMINSDVYLISNTVIIVSLLYTVFSYKRIRWVFDVLPLIIIKILEINLFILPQSYLSQKLTGLFGYNIFSIDSGYFYTMIVILLLYDNTIFIHYDKQNNMKYLIVGLSAILFVILP